MSTERKDKILIAAEIIGLVKTFLFNTSKITINHIKESFQDDEGDNEH